ncbi:phytanoyl-CoA dioxygenase family protein [Novosphingobium sp. MW5]|nr:phytanoyl-CoA dioxygenase family protein [Novosphingobium sp. MW5]
MRSPPAIREEDIAAYKRDGAVVLRGVLDAGTLALLEAGVEAAYSTRDHRHSIVRTADGTGETIVGQYPSQSSPSLAALVGSGLPGEIAARMMGTQSAQLVLDQIFYKSPGPIAPTPWHQDTPFLRVRGEQMVRVWLCCDPSPADLTVQVVRGSHRWNVVYNTRTMATSPVLSERKDEFEAAQLGDAFLPLVPDIAANKDSFDIMRFDVEPGDALIFQGNMLHGADGRDWYDHARRAFAMLWGGPELRHHRSEGKTFPPPGGEPDGPIPDGDPLRLHPASFPVGWSA